MGSLPVLKAREVAALLVRLGFQEVRQRGSHRQVRHVDGRRDLVLLEQVDEVLDGSVRMADRVDDGHLESPFQGSPGNSLMIRSLTSVSASSRFQSMPDRSSGTMLSRKSWSLAFSWRLASN